MRINSEIISYTAIHNYGVPTAAQYYFKKIDICHLKSHLNTKYNFRHYIHYGFYICSYYNKKTMMFIMVNILKAAVSSIFFLIYLCLRRLYLLYFMSCKYNVFCINNMDNRIILYFMHLSLPCN
jgi:hypothetical protein